MATMHTIAIPTWISMHTGHTTAASSPTWAMIVGLHHKPGMADISDLNKNCWYITILLTMAFILLCLLLVWDRETGGVAFSLPALHVSCLYTMLVLPVSMPCLCCC